MLRNDVVSSRALAFLAYPETDLANLGSALRKARAYREIAERNEDQNLLAQASRLFAFLGSRAGWHQFMSEAKGMVRGEALTESSAFVKFCEGQYELGLGNFQEAAILLSQSATEMSRLGDEDNELRARLLLDYANHQVGSSSQDSLEMRSFDKFPSLAWIAGLLRSARSGEKTIATVFSQTSQEFWVHGRFMELLDWFPLLIRNLSDEERQQLKSRAISIIQRAASSLDDYDLRREFLEFPRIKEALLLVRKN